MPHFDLTCQNGHDVYDVWATSRPSVCAVCGEPSQTIWGASHGIQAATWPGGKTFENLGHEPKTFYSPHELKAYLKANRIEEFVRHTPIPGTDKSPHTVRWTSMSQETLDGAAQMLTRVSTSGKDDVPSYVREMTVQITEGR